MKKDKRYILRCPSHGLSYPILFFLVAMSSQSFGAARNSSDWTTLLAFKSMISDSTNALASWQHDNTTVPFCQWRGVTCGRRHPNRVTSLILHSLDLAGSLPPHIANLTFLRSLNLFNNSFTGTIPPELGRLSRLTHLSLGDNHLHGQIPENLTQCSNLQQFDLGNNELSGEIPRDIGSLSKLRLLSLGQNNLTGTIPPSLGNISSLLDLFLFRNDLVGSIPHELGRLSQLSFLYLEFNHLDGEIPLSLTSCSNVQIIDLENNALFGNIPRDNGSLSKLELFSLANNDLTGTIPPSLGNISSLLTLYLGDNNLEGTIPVSIGKLSNLQLLDLGNNKLFGNIPSILFNLSFINYLTLFNNSFMGTLPPDMFYTLPKLQTLYICDNQLEGPIPFSLSNATNMENLQLGDNYFIGTIPSNLGNLRNLISIELSLNRLEAKEPSDWDFLTSLTNCTKLQSIGIGGNNLSSVLPPSVANLSSTLQYFQMQSNQIGGAIPYGIGNLGNLTGLYLSDNLLTGDIPDSIGNLQQLNELYLFRNHLTGQIPNTIGNLAELNKLYLYKNSLNGSIPASIGKCKSLQVVFLNNNMLTGVVPRELLMIPSLSMYLDLADNLLTGTLPVEVGQLSNLNELRFSNNKLYGEIPGTIGSCRSLQYLFMDSNFFDGAIPESMSGLKGLRQLDLSQNNLSGKVPVGMVNLGGLEHLNLSYNHLEGEVPDDGIFTNANIVSVLGNKNLCGGSPNLRLPSCQNYTPKEHHRSHAIKVIIPVVVASLFILILFFVLFYYLHRLKNQRNTSPSTSFMKEKFKNVSYAELLKATDRFSPSNLIGVGGVGSVYRGTLKFEENTIVAVKVLNLQHQGASKSFMAECDVLKNIRHRNLVKILTLCSSVDFSGNEFKALVVEFMPNGSLEKWLHPTAPGHSQFMPLSLDKRLNIAIDVASALEYLHHHGQTPIVHCDLKPSNILLDADMCAHVGDFGLARVLWDKVPEHNGHQSISSGIKGTIGYVPPEYGMGGQASTYGDVYSYGILLLELFTGRRPTDEMFKDGLSLYSYAEMAFPERVRDIVDSRLLLFEKDLETRENIQNEGDDRMKINKCLVSLIGVGVSCSKQDPRERMEMSEIKNELHAIKDALHKSEAHDG